MNDRLDVEVILWRGKYWADGKDRLSTLLKLQGGMFNRLRDPQLHGDDGNWWVTAICEPH